MMLAPEVLVNGVAAGPAGDASGLVAGEEAMLSHAALGRPARAEDVVAAVLFLCDPRNSYTTGQVLAIDAGWSAGFARDF
jgi:NAD(P)-dependent dehydrogenase (short-subunit alcohol dehydrogenase family)